MKEKTPKPAEAPQVETEIQINVKLIGSDAVRFNRYKENQKLKASAAAAFKLMFERLDQVEPAQPAA